MYVSIVLSSKSDSNYIASILLNIKDRAWCMSQINAYRSFCFSIPPQLTNEPTKVSKTLGLKSIVGFYSWG